LNEEIMRNSRRTFLAGIAAVAVVGMSYAMWNFLASEPTAFVVWIDEDDHVMAIEQMFASRVDEAVREGAEDLTPLIIYQDSPLFTVAASVLADDDPAEAAEEVALVKRAREAPNVFAARFPK
jgi:hypothetical protein